MSVERLVEVALPWVGVKIVLERNVSVRREHEFSSEVGNEQAAMLSTLRRGPQGGCVWKGGSLGPRRGRECSLGREERSLANLPGPGPLTLEALVSSAHFC